MQYLEFKSNNINSIVFSVSESKKFYLNDMEKIIERPMTQKMKTVKYEAGCFWVVNINSFMKNKNRIIEPYDTVVVGEQSALDIDDHEDMEIVDFILSKKIRKSEKRYYKTRARVKSGDVYYSDRNVDPDGIARNILYEEESRVEFAQNEIKYINNHATKLAGGKKLKILSMSLGGGYVKNISNYYEKYGIEPDVEAAKIAKNNVDYLFKDRFENVKFNNSTFDVVFAHHVIEHIENPIGFVHKINAILKVGGKLIIGTPNFDSGAARRYGQRYRMLNDPTHISLFSELGLRELLSDHGFFVEYVDYPYFETKYFNEHELLRILDKDIVSPPFYGNIMTFYATKM